MTPSFWRQIVLSFSSGGFYQTVARQPLAKSLRYFTLLILIASVLLSARYALVLSQVLGEAEGWARQHLPEIRITKGKVQSPVSQPWRHAVDQLFVVILDTTGQTQEIPSEFAQGILLTQDRMILKRQPSDIRSYDLSKIEAFRLNAEVLGEFRRKGKWFFWPLLWGGFFGYFLVGKFAQVLLFSGISLVTSRVSGRALPYGALLNIGLYAVTLPFLLGAALALFGPPPPLFSLFFVAVYGALLVTAVLHCVPPQEAAPEETVL